VALKKGGQGKGTVVMEVVCGLLGFVALLCVGVYFCCSGGCLCQGCRGLELCTVGTVH
jgi:hypothetical protein